MLWLMYIYVHCHCHYFALLHVLMRKAPKLFYYLRLANFK